MPIDFAIDLDNKEAVTLAMRLEKIAKQTGITVRDVYADQMRLLMQDLMSAKVPLPKSAPQGRKAIDRDLNKLFVKIDQRPVLQFFEDDFSTGELPSSVIFNLEGNERRMEGFWRRHRIKAGRYGGRVRYRGRIVATVGEWKFFNKMYVPRISFNRFRRRLHADVAKLKAGWVIAGQKLADMVGRGIRIPSWVMKRAEKDVQLNLGRLIVAMRKDGSGYDGNGYIAATNSVPYAVAKYEDTGIMNDFIYKRQKDIFDGINVRLQRLIDQFNTGMQL
jgi:hypothetical protein